MDRFERIEAYPNTFLALLPLELRKLLSLYVYHCNFTIEVSEWIIGPTLTIGTNGIAHSIHFPKNIISKIPQLVTDIRADRIKVIEGTNLKIGYVGADIELSIISPTSHTLIPLCKNLLDALIELTKL